MKKRHISTQNLKNTGLSRAPDGKFKAGSHWRPHNIFREKAYLLSEYITKNRSSRDIANEHSVTDGAILFWLKKHEIPRRDVSEARRVKKWGSSGNKNPMFGRCGDRNPNWKDGSSPERQRRYAQTFWKELQKAVYERDGYMCVRCGDPHTGKNKLHAHHVMPWAGNVDTRFEMKNIITLCNHCHQWVHSKRNKKHEYLSS